MIVTASGLSTWDEIRNNALPPTLKNELVGQPLWIDISARCATISETAPPVIRTQLTEDLHQLILLFYPGRSWAELRGEERLQRRKALALMWTSIAILALATSIAALMAVRAVKQTRVAEAATGAAKEATARAERSAERARRELASEATQRMLAQTSAAEEVSARTNAESQKVEAQIQRNVAQQNARIAVSRQLAGVSQMKRDTQLDLAALLAIEAQSAARTSDSRNALLQSFQASPGMITYLHHPVKVNGVAFSSDNKTLASADINGTVRLWDITTHQQLGDPLKKGNDHSTNTIAFSADGKMLASGGEEGRIQFWDVVNRQLVGEIVLDDPMRGHSANIFNLAFSPNGKLLASASWDHTVILWDMISHQPIAPPLRGHTDHVVSVAFSPDSKIMASASQDNTVRLWDASLKSPLEDSVPVDLGAIRGVAFGKTDDLLAVAGDKGMQLWNIKRHRRLDTPAELRRGVASRVVFSPDWKTMAVARRSKIEFWDVASRQPVGPGITGSTDAITFSPDGNAIAWSTSDGDIRLWDVARASPLGEPFTNAPYTHDITFSPNGKLLASASLTGVVQVWDVAQRKVAGSWLVGTQSWPVQAFAVAFDRKSGLLASGGSDRLVRLFDVTSYKPLGGPLQGHSDVITSVAFSPDGKILASAGGDVRLWDVDLHQPVGEPLEGREIVAWSVSGKLLATTSAAKNLVLYDLDPDSWVSRLCSLANRNLFLYEWQQYMGVNVPYRRTCPSLPVPDEKPSE